MPLKVIFTGCERGCQWQLPVIIGIENNAWGLSTPSEQQFKCAHFTDKAIGYGIPKEDAIQVDGTTSLTCTTKWPDLLNLYESDLGLSY